MRIDLSHGMIIPLGTSEEEAIDLINHDVESTRPFWYMFEGLQYDDKARLETSAETVKKLRALGETMIEEQAIRPNVFVPAIYTFFGQFVDHDITLEMGSSKIALNNASPLSLDEVHHQIVNSRSPDLDLDQVYGPDLKGNMAPRYKEEQLLLDPVPGSDKAPRKDLLNDLPRNGDGVALVGDPREDANIVLSQLHVAFMKAHNVLVKGGLKFEAARETLCQHYQWIVLNDFLKRIADPIIVDKVRYRQPKFFRPKGKFFMPLEFSGAVYRFGHSKVRAAYDGFNAPNQGGDLGLLFSRARQPLTSDWVIDWTHFVKPETNMIRPRPIDTLLTELLFTLLPAQVIDKDFEPNLAIRNLLRGYILRLPTGQAVANYMASDGISPMTRDDMNSVPEIQYKVLEDTGLIDNTPLWFYILAEAWHSNKGQHLGPVGSTIVSEVLIGVLRNSTYSILKEPDWRPTLGETAGKFDLEDLLKLADVF